MIKKVIATGAIAGVMMSSPLVGEAALGDHTLKQGMWDKDVHQLQQKLKDKGYFHYTETTGFYGDITAASVKDFQKRNGLKVDGIAGKRTAEALLQSSLGKSNILKQGNKGYAVSGLQSELKDQGFYNYTVDGIYGPVTVNAVKAFQKAKGIAVDGLTGPQTIKALYGENGVRVRTEVESSAPAQKASAPVKAASTDQKQGKTVSVEATAYTADCDGCSGVTANGTNLKANPDVKVIAVDPDVIPLNSQVYVEGYGYAVAADKGGAIQGNRIDVFYSSKQKATEWGRKNVKVTILDK
ncbi:peptidoglycan-binding protein [Fictibacillus sp. WQ 8-8]|uniref:peptidoglycan-binding protein n=1 Tax=unclassified Fictibacillus TaxID=2644029 RepID=UPI0006A7B875|nr:MULTISPECIES: peptidoglycan-binding protein [unclassified Fictibacillus]MCQ6266917.1 peptidoglycan-binding protein [Fictibacillus sp. WQ 8-8]MED2973950.1 peptidoglycan-binding protein [Fictibacillus sp. B-59209]SFE17390.1 3D (Asp-Asp-Asp) domain-containing protein [Bacillus sp. OV194]